MTLDAVCGAATDALVYDTFNAAAAAHDAWTAGTSAAAMPREEGDREKVQGGRRKRRRRARSCRNREEAESQRMTHIAVERNRRRQMNEYLAVLRSLMPDSYAHRGDQASIVGGAIDFVKELEQQLQSLEAQKRALLSSQQQRKPPIRDAIPTTPSTAVTATAAATTSSGGTGAGEEPSSPPAHEEDAGAPFARFFTYPQYVWRQRRPREDYRPTEAEPEEKRGGGTAAADIEVSLVETHASVRVMAPRRPGQLLRMVAGMEALRLAVLHLNVTALDSLALYSLSLKVEEGCGLATADDVAAAVHHVICIIHGEATSQQRMLTGRQPELLS